MTQRDESRIRSREEINKMTDDEFVDVPQIQIPRLPDGPLRDGEREIMAHRYLYYVLDSPVIGDTTYDIMDRSFLERVPMDGPERSVTHQVGSSLEESYTEDEIARAHQLIPKRMRRKK